MRDELRTNRRNAVWAITLSCIAVIVVLTNDMDGTAEVSKLVEQQAQSPCATVADQVEVANAEQAEAIREHHEHLRKAAQLSNAVEEAGLTATRLETEHRSRKQRYMALRAKLQGEVKAFSADVDKYNQLRELAITNEQKCGQRKVSECEPGPDGTPDCKEVVHDNHFCKEAEKLAKQAAEHAGSLKLLRGTQGQLLRAKLAVQSFTKQAQTKVAEVQQQQAEAKQALDAEQSVLLEVQARAHHTRTFAEKLMHTKKLCESIRKREHSTTASLKHLENIKQMAQALPATPWKLTHKQRLQAEYRAATDKVKDVEKDQLAAAKSAMKDGTSSLGATAEAADAAADALIGPPANPQQYLHQAVKQAQQVNSEELKKLEPQVSASQRALDAQVPTPQLQAAITKLREADSGDRARAEAQDALQKAQVKPQAAVMTEDKAPVVVPVPVAPTVAAAPALVGDAPPVADDVAPPDVAAADAGAAQAAADGAKKVAKAAADAAAATAKQQAKLAKVQADAAAKVAQAQQAAPAAGAGDAAAKAAAADLKTAAAKKKAALKKKAADKLAEKKKKAKKKLKQQQKQAMEKLKKKKARMDKEALAGIPDELEHTGTTAMKLSNARSASRLDRRFMGAKRKLWEQQGKAIDRLERSPGGTAARHAARHMREAAQDEVRKYEIQSVRQAMQYQQKTEGAKEKALRDDYAAKFRDLERSDKYAFALKQLVAESWWHGLYQTSLVQARGKCDQMASDRQMACMKNLQENQIWLAKNLRAKDVVFQKKYAAYKSKHSTEREAYLSKKRQLASEYQSRTDHLKADYDQAQEHRQWEMGQQARAKLAVQNHAKLSVVGDGKAS
jgi:histone H1/5